MSETDPTTPGTPQAAHDPRPGPGPQAPAYAPGGPQSAGSPAPGQPAYAPPPQPWQQPQQPWQQPAQAGQLPPHFAPAPGAQRGRVNVLGVTALAIIVVGVLVNILTPLLYRFAAFDGMGAVFGVVTGVQAVIHLVAGGLAIAGVLQKQAPRLRWTAIGALVSSAIWVLAWAGTLVTGWIASALPYPY